MQGKRGKSAKNRARIAMGTRAELEDTRRLSKNYSNLVYAGTVIITIAVFGNVIGHKHGPGGFALP